MRFLLTHPDAQGAGQRDRTGAGHQRGVLAHAGRVIRRPCLFRAPAFVLRLAMGEMADALLLKGQRVVPARAQEMGFKFEYQTLEPALRAILR